MNTEKAMPASQVAEAKKNAKAFAANEGKGNEAICKLGDNSVMYWSFYGRTEGSKKMEYLCREAGVRRSIDQTTQRRFALFSFLSKKNIGIQTVGERVWQSIADRVAIIKEEGTGTNKVWSVSFAKLRNAKGEETTETTEKLFSELSAERKTPILDADGKPVLDADGNATYNTSNDFADCVGNVLDAKFPSKGAGKKLIQEAHKAELAKVGAVPLTWNGFSALNGKNKEQVIESVKALFTTTNPELRQWIANATPWIIEALQAIPAPATPATSTTTVASPPMPTEKEASVTAATVA